MPNSVSYSSLMENSDGYIEIRLSLDNPIEISDFAALFAGVGSEFDRYLAEQRPELAGSARMFVHEVRQGSTIASLFASIPDMIGIMDGALIVLGFGALFNRRLRDLIQGKKIEGATKPQLADITRAVRAVAEDPNGTMGLKGIRFREGVFTTEFEAVFTATEARAALQTIEAQKAELDKITASDHSRVLMRFTRPDVGDAPVGKRSGERVVVESISDKDRALVYGSDLAERQIKDELRNTDENIFKRGFVVDMDLVFSGGKPVAYSVRHLHQVIDLEED